MLKLYEFSDTELQGIWKNLYKNNPYLFPYSSYEYNEQVIKYVHFKLQALNWQNLFYVYFVGTIPKLILPLTLRKNKLYLFGELVSGPGALDIIYGTDVNAQDFTAALSELFKLHPLTQLELYKLNERSKFCQFLLDDKSSLGDEYHLRHFVDRECVKVVIPSKDYDDYFQGLTRNSKSNLKKLYNRLEKNNISFALKVVQGPMHDKAFLKDVTRIYVKRELERTHKSFAFIHEIKNRYFSALTWAAERLDSHYTFAIYLNGQMGGFTTGFETNFNEIIFPRLAIDSEFSAYSPGKLLINEMVRWCQENHQVSALDLSRGTERYKFEMGGHKHLNYGFVMEKA